jgi:DNA-binding transcriptional LysR family regulator
MRDVDVGIFPLPAIVPPELGAAIIGRSLPWVALPRGHALVGDGRVPLSRLLGEPLILPPMHPVWHDNLRLIAREHGREPARGPDVATMAEALVLVSEGRGWTIAAGRGDFQLWDGVVMRPAAEVAPVRVAALWSRAHDAPQKRVLAESLGAAAIALERTAMRR